MKRTAVTLLAMALFLSACIPALPSLQQPVEQEPAVDVQATDAALAATLAVETLNALPTPTLEPATNTPEPTFTEAIPATMTETATATVDPNASVTATETSEISTSDAGTADTATATSVVASATVTATETLYARFYGTLPPAIPFGKIKLINRSKTEVYVSLQCTTVDGYKTILEYPVNGSMKVSAPAGWYIYVAWVGGRQYEGQFGLTKNGDVEITFGQGKITVK
jgi:hypothetical protein